jgi:hypothetical protein
VGPALAAAVLHVACPAAFVYMADDALKAVRAPSLFCVPSGLSSFVYMADDALKAVRAPSLFCVPSGLSSLGHASTSTT